MKTLIKKKILLGTLLLLSLTSYVLAAPALPVSSQLSEGANEEKIEIVEEIKIEVQSPSATSNPKLKEGIACSDENLEEAQGELIIVVPAIPMAKTMPCDSVDCKDLQAAQMQNYKMKKLPPKAKTISCEK